MSAAPSIAAFIARIPAGDSDAAEEPAQARRKQLSRALNHVARELGLDEEADE